MKWFSSKIQTTQHRLLQIGGVPAFSLGFQA
jgi:hypothetical protein